MRYFFNKIKNQKSGFTLIELMVATSIFMMIMLMAMGSIVVSGNASKRTQKLRYAMDNVNFALESMTRSIRMGTNYEETSKGISFLLDSELDGESQKIEYFLGTEERQEYNSLYRTIDDSPAVKIVSSDVNVEKLDFIIKGNRENDGSPSVYILMKGTVNIKGQENTSFAIQTMASQRNIEEIENTGEEVVDNG
jgi:prepilin-type N-terminal cleavage/methylation domain-containing protein